jgi:hypothetical protein
MSEALNAKPNAEPLPRVGTVGVLLDGHYLPPPADQDGKIWVRTSALVHADPHVLYQIWRDVETIPLWQEQIARVTRTGEKTSHWEMRSGDTGKIIEWDSEILADEPGRRIAWRSIGGDSDNAGEVVFEPSLADAQRWSQCCRNFAWANSSARGRPLWAAIRNRRSLKTCAYQGFGGNRRDPADAGPAARSAGKHRRDKGVRIRRNNRHAARIES